MKSCKFGIIYFEIVGILLQHLELQIYMEHVEFLHYYSLAFLSLSILLSLSMAKIINDLKKNKGIKNHDEYENPSFGLLEVKEKY